MLRKLARLSHCLLARGLTVWPHAVRLVTHDNPEMIVLIDGTGAYDVILARITKCAICEPLAFRQTDVHTGVDVLVG